MRAVEWVAGEMFYREWFALPERFQTIELDAFIVMPNHIHGIIVIHNPPVGAGLVPAQNHMSDQERRASTRGALTQGDVDRNQWASTRDAPTMDNAGREYRAPTWGARTQGDFVKNC